ncbi:XrtA-associated tyrosine autokinase [Scleromatobacter humisilvae]|uniref:XrtA-associated tyrosine autokinase n=1 Tax=Scleromatobacter humisilvae TaxID=2897159 RepID=A0A9X2BZ76_9BURK|nr:XrtA-associated tyrosine autokinase [Scleromatobacter humisilvae]MCK9686373.1 XrtA-associated tyrosine autokinase [Scleromatobacter humisilvae]
MASLIEQAAERLEQLRRAGAMMPEDAPVPAAPPTAPAIASAPRVVAAPATIQPAPTAKRVELDLAALAASGLVTPNAPRSQTADEYRVIKRPLISNAMGKGASILKHGNLIMVTSALAGEGKSYTAVNLAMSIAAELDNTVMLVDADVARPSLLRMLNLPPSAGLLDVLKGEAEMSNVLLRTSIEKLTLLPSGTPHPRSTELLASDAMRLLLDDIAKRYPDRIIIFDSPPLLLTTEARVLATQMGQVVMVVQAEKTLRADVQRALATIEACPVRMMLLNMSRSGSPTGEGYGYGHGYSYDGPAERQPAA